MLKVFLNDFPDFYIVEITNRCNIRCPACPWHTCMTRQIHDMTFEEYRLILDKIAPYAKAVCFYVMGEPLLNPDWHRIVKITHDRGIKTIISSNGMLLKENIDKIFSSGLDYLQVAIDGKDAETHESYRIGSDYSKVMSALRIISELKKKRECLIPEVAIQTLVTKQNENQIEIIKKQMDNLGFGFKLKRMHYGRTNDLEKKNKPIFMPTKEEYVRIGGKNYYSAGIDCPEMKYMVILSNGEVVPCCVDFDAKQVIGNIFQESVSDIWTGNKHMDFINQYKSRQNTFCERCDLC